MVGHAASPAVASRCPARCSSIRLNAWWSKPTLLGNIDQIEIFELPGKIDVVEQGRLAVDG
jgi:hypothetical protein